MTEERAPQHWVYEDEERRLRPARPEELRREPVDTSKLKVGDFITVAMPVERLFEMLETGPFADALALPVGRAFLAWTAACALVLGLFAEMAGIDEATAQLIFNRVRSDRTQRDLVLDAAKVRLVDDPDLLAELKAALKELDALATDRNVFAHVSFGVRFDDDLYARMKPNQPTRWETHADPVEVASKLAKDLRGCRGRLSEVMKRVRRSTSLEG